MKREKDELTEAKPLVHVDGCCCTLCNRKHGVSERLRRLMPKSEAVREGAEDPNLALDYDPLFAKVLGTAVSRRDLLKIAALAAAGGLGAMLAAPRASAQQEPRKKKPFDPVIKIGYIPITDAATLLVAHELGFFKREGLESEPPTLIRGWSPLVEAFSAQRFNLSHMLIPLPIYMRYYNKFPIKITAWNHTNGSALVVSKKSGVMAPHELGGKQLAVPYWYSIHNIIAQRIVRNAGLTPVIRPQDAKLAPNEVNFLVLNPPDMPPALAAGQIDAYIVAEPFNALGELKAGGRILRFTGDVWKGHPCCVVVMHEDDAMDPARAEWAQAIHRAIVKAQLHLRDNRKAMAEMLSKDGKKYLPFDKEVVERVLLFYDAAYYSQPPAIKHPQWQQHRINFQPWPYPSATKRVVEEMRDLLVGGEIDFVKKLSPDFVAQDLVQYTYVKKALEENPGWRADLSVPQTGDPFNRVEVIQL
ncbi:MAG: ABC transporter substrate-binding protein [Burkholderiales bacterium]|nr:ABC transporter substrate-binding protein [Burkholderiales bacterium]